MDELDLFTTARPDVEPPDDAVLARIRMLAFADAAMAVDVDLDVDVDDGALAEDPPSPVVTVGGRTRRRTGARVWMLAAAAVGLLVAGVIVAQHTGSPSRTTSGSNPATGPTADASAPGGSGETLTPAQGPAASPGGSAETRPAVDRPVNVLVVGVDNHECVDPDSPYAGAFGDRTSAGERSDTIMVLRLDPATDRAAILSFPRDLWVPIAGTGGEQRINTAFERDDPQRLIDTIHATFGIGVDHFVQVDFCAFAEIVDAVGGVSVPFEYPTRDRNTGLNIDRPGCVTFDGDAALAYVRSRHYQYFSEGTWHTDPVSDLGRISRQQDFVRRLLAAMGERGMFDVDLLAGVIEAVQEHVVVDSGLTISSMLAFGSELADLDPGAIAGYQIDAVGRTIAGQAVLEPVLDSEHTQAVLAVFRGEAPLAAPPVPIGPTTTGVAAEPEDPTRGSEPLPTGAPAAPASSVPAPGAPAPNPLGVVPPAEVSC